MHPFPTDLGRESPRQQQIVGGSLSNPKEKGQETTAYKKERSLTQVHQILPY
jgi:hypothetical protein